MQIINKHMLAVLVLASLLSASGYANSSIVKIAALHEVRVVTDRMFTNIAKLLRGEFVPKHDLSATTAAVQDYFAQEISQTASAAQALELLETYTRWANATEQRIDTLFEQVSALDTDSHLLRQLDRIKQSLADRSTQTGTGAVPTANGGVRELPRGYVGVAVGLTSDGVWERMPHGVPAR